MRSWEGVLMTSLVPSSFPQLQQDLLEAFLSGRNEKTIEAYKQDLESFRQFLGTSTRKEAIESFISLPHGEANGVALAYRSHLTNQGLQPATINRRLAALRSFVKLARTLGFLSWHLDIENVKSRSYRDTKGPGKEGVRTLLNSLHRPTHKNIRDRAIIHLLYDLGLRRSEVVGMNRTDVQLEAGTIDILGKGRTQKEALTLPEPTKAALAAWMAVRGEEPGPLFLNFDRAKKGKRLTGVAVYLIVRKLGEKANVKARPHGLRHAAITEALEVTKGNVRAVQRFSRHRSVQTLLIYDDNRADLGGVIARQIALSS